MKTKKGAIQSGGVKILNPEKKPLTKEKLKELSGLHDLKEHEAEEMVQSIHLFAKLLYETSRQKANNAITPPIIHLPIRNKAA